MANAEMLKPVELPTDPGVLSKLMGTVVCVTQG